MGIKINSPQTYHYWEIEEANVTAAPLELPFVLVAPHYQEVDAFDGAGNPLTSAKIGSRTKDWTDFGVYAEKDRYLLDDLLPGAVLDEADLDVYRVSGTGASQVTAKSWGTSDETVVVSRSGGTGTLVSDGGGVYTLTDPTVNFNTAATRAGVSAAEIAAGELWVRYPGYERDMFKVTAIKDDTELTLENTDPEVATGTFAGLTAYSLVHQPKVVGVVAGPRGASVRIQGIDRPNLSTSPTAVTAVLPTEFSIRCDTGGGTEELVLWWTDPDNELTINYADGGGPASVLITLGAGSTTLDITDHTAGTPFTPSTLRDAIRAEVISKYGADVMSPIHINEVDYSGTFAGDTLDSAGGTTITVTQGGVPTTGASVVITNNTVVQRIPIYSAERNHPIIVSNTGVGTGMAITATFSDPSILVTFDSTPVLETAGATTVWDLDFGGVDDLFPDTWLDTLNDALVTSAEVAGSTFDDDVPELLEEPIKVLIDDTAWTNLASAGYRIMAPGGATGSHLGFGIWTSAMGGGNQSSATFKREVVQWEAEITHPTAGLGDDWSLQWTVTTDPAPALTAGEAGSLLTITTGADSVYSDFFDYGQSFSDLETALAALPTTNFTLENFRVRDLTTRMWRDGVDGDKATAYLAPYSLPKAENYRQHTWDASDTVYTAEVGVPQINTTDFSGSSSFYAVDIYPEGHTGTMPTDIYAQYRALRTDTTPAATMSQHGRTADLLQVTRDTYTTILGTATVNNPLSLLAAQYFKAAADTVLYVQGVEAVDSDNPWGTRAAYDSVLALLKKRTGYHVGFINDAEWMDEWITTAANSFGGTYNDGTRRANEMFLYKPVKNPTVAPAVLEQQGTVTALSGGSDEVITTDLNFVTAFGAGPYTDLVIVFDAYPEWTAGLVELSNGKRGYTIKSIGGASNNIVTMDAGVTGLLKDELETGSATFAVYRVGEALVNADGTYNSSAAKDALVAYHRESGRYHYGCQKVLVDYVTTTVEDSSTRVDGVYGLGTHLGVISRQSAWKPVGTRVWTGVTRIEGTNELYDPEELAELRGAGLCIPVQIGGPFASVTISDDTSADPQTDEGAFDPVRKKRSATIANDLWQRRVNRAVQRHLGDNNVSEEWLNLVRMELQGEETWFRQNRVFQELEITYLRSITAADRAKYGLNTTGLIVGTRRKHMEEAHAVIFDNVVEV